MSNAILNMMKGPQPRNHNAKREIMSMIDVLRAVSGRVTTRGDSCIEELEQVAATMVKIIRGIDANVDFGLPTEDIEALKAENAALKDQILVLTAAPVGTCIPVEDPEAMVEVPEVVEAPPRRRGRPAKVVAPE